MAKLLLISVIVSTIVIPAWASADKRPRRALQKLLFGVAGFNALYAAGLLFFYYRLLD